MQLKPLNKTLVMCLGLPLLISYRDACPDNAGKPQHEKPILTKEIRPSTALRVKKIVAEQLGIKEEISNDASFVDNLGADELDVVELIMALEEEFEFEIPDDDAEKILTVQNAIDCFKSKCQHIKPPQKNR